MNNARKILNALSLGVLCAGAVTLVPATGSADLPPLGGSCCNDAGSNCYTEIRASTGSVVTSYYGTYYEGTGGCPPSDLDPE